MTRRRRTFAAALAAFALVFAQFAVSAHACEAISVPGQGATSHPEGCAGAMPEEDAGINVCEQHCQYGDASFDSNPPGPSALPPSGASLKVEMSTDPAAETSPRLRRAPPAAAAPPPALLFGVLRI